MLTLADFTRWKWHKEEERNSRSHVMARQPSLMENYNNIEDNSTWFCHPSEVNTQCFLVQWVLIPRTTFVSVIYLFSFFFSVLFFFSCQWFYLVFFWTPWFSLQNVPILFQGFYILLCVFLAFLFDSISATRCSFSISYTVMLRTIKFIIFAGSAPLQIGKEFFLQNILRIWFLVQLLIQLVVARIQNYQLQYCGNVFIKNKQLCETLFLSTPLL